jgi:hypothetical protein
VDFFAVSLKKKLGVAEGIVIIIVVIIIIIVVVVVDKT